MPNSFYLILCLTPTEDFYRILPVGDKINVYPIEDKINVCPIGDSALVFFTGRVALSLGARWESYAVTYSCAT